MIDPARLEALAECARREAMNLDMGSCDESLADYHVESMQRGRELLNEIESELRAIAAGAGEREPIKEFMSPHQKYPERKPGRTKLVYDKTRRTIVSVTEPPPPKPEAGRVD